MIRPQAVNLSCPRCRFSYRAPVLSIIDVGQAPELKQYLLSGQLNGSQCPNCGNVNFVAAPILYHDPAHSFVGLHVPSQANLNPGQRQKMIGDLSKALMDSLPQEQRRAYMLSPQEFLTIEGMIEKILGFDGITPEMIAASRKKMELVPRLLRQKDDALAFAIMVKDNESLLDQEFFMLLSNLIDGARSQEQMEEAQALIELREKLLPVTETGRKIERQRAAVRLLGERPTRQSAFDAVLASDLDGVEAIAVVARPIMDYEFFQRLSERIEQSDSAEKQTLEAKRQRILEVQEYLKAADAQVLQAASEVLQALLSAEDMDQAIKELMPYIDQNVLGVLMANIEEAGRRGATAAVQRLQELWDKIGAATDEAVPPQTRLLMRLMDADYPDETRALLRENRELVTPEFLDYLQNTVVEMEKRVADTPDAAEAIRHLRNVVTQARLGV